MSLPISQSIQNHPEQVAFMDGVTSIRYAELPDLLASYLVKQRNAVQTGEHVAWCPGNDVEAFLTFWALQISGLVACPISHRFPETKRSEVVARLDAHWLPDLNDSLPKDEATLNDVSGYDLHSPATIILSSGSTGVPKAVVHSMAAHVASATGAAVNMPLAAGDRWLWSLPLCHISGLSILVRCAVAGATVAGFPKEDIKLSGELLNELQVSHLSVVSTQLRRLLEESHFPSPFLKAVLLGGSSVDPNLVAMARERGVNVSTTYGLSETASQVTTSTVDDPPETSGRLLPGRELKLDSNGEILIRGDTLCLGYYRNGKIVPDVDQDGWFATKDLGSMTQDQLLLVRGRLDNMFVSGGENIYPENIEREMRRAFSPEQVCVVPKPDRQFGFRPVAFVLGDLPADWESTLREHLKGYEIPVEILAWPSEAEGALKVDRKKLADRLAK